MTGLVLVISGNRGYTLRDSLTGSSFRFLLQTGCEKLGDA